MKFLLFASLFLSFPAVVGSAAGATAAAPHPAPETALFQWVPAGGFPDHFPFGQCTWWAAYNRHVTWNGNAGDWLANASAQGFQTQGTPSLGAIVVYRPGSGYSQLGHVGVVIAASPTTYTISEMYVIAFGEVDTRTIGWPDPHVEGFIPLSKKDL